MDSRMDTFGLIQNLKEHYAKKWATTPDTFPAGLEKFEPLHQKARDERMRVFVDEVLSLIKGFSVCSEEESARWGTNLKGLIYDCGTGIVGLDGSSVKMLLEDGFCEVTSDFVTDARAFDAAFKLDDISQALRNVWIVNCIQKLMDQSICMTSSIQAYSMLYPYTDNFLDTNAISMKKKGILNGRFERRLAGEHPEPENTLESKLFQLVGMVEEQYVRTQYPMVYECLLGIHAAQVRSLQQQDKKNAAGSICDILEISVEKGGSSVLADACLVKGSLSPQEADFSFGFGILLQFLDDLQDAATDRSNGYRTIFSDPVNGGSMESNTNRLINLTCEMLNDGTCFTSSGALEVKRLIKKSVLLLILGAVACNSSMYDPGYLKRLETFSPLSFEYFKSFYKKIGREYGKFKLKLSVMPLEEPMAKAFAAGSL